MSADGYSPSSHRKDEFDTTSIHVGFALNKVTPLTNLSASIRFSYNIVPPKMLHFYLHPSPIVGKLIS